MRKIERIQNSWKATGYCEVSLVDEKYSWKKSTIQRKVYTRKDGIKLIVVDNNIWSFKYDSSGEGININKVGPRKEGFKNEDLEELEIPGSVLEVNIDEPEEIEIPEPTNPLKVRHQKFQEILTCVEANIPVYLYGPAGSGKNYVIQEVAEALGLDFYFTNSVQQEYKITGFVTPKLSGEDTFVETEFYRAFKNGGLFFLDEMDASIPEVLVLLNAAIANGYFEFPGQGKIDAHPDFRVIAAGNTVGNGADEQYTGRLVLDQATLDRFVAIEFDYDRNIELVLAKGNVQLVDFVRELRKQAQEKGIRTTFSYRCIITVQKLEGKLAAKELMKIAIFKGMDKDTINTFKPYSMGNNKYATTLKELQGAI